MSYFYALFVQCTILMTVLGTMIVGCDATLGEAAEQNENDLKVWTFNLEGRGGNQATKFGEDRRTALMTKMSEICNCVDCPQPDILLTQEDTQEDIGPCFRAVAECTADVYGWTEKHKYGDGTLMRNKVYVNKKLDAVNKNLLIEAWPLQLASEKAMRGGWKPRCAAIAKLNLNGTTVTIASFHLTGGPVDDEVAFFSATDMPALTQNVREDMLKALAQNMRETSGDNKLIILGGDTNGFPENQLYPCQGGRLSTLIKAWVKSSPEYDNPEGRQKITSNMYKYLTTPDALLVTGPTTLRRIQAATEAVGASLLQVAEDAETEEQAGDAPAKKPKDGKTICSSVDDSTTIWGGQTDSFYTNLAAKAAVLPIAMNNVRHSNPPFDRVLSDHNPVELTVKLRPEHQTSQKELRPDSDGATTQTQESDAEGATTQTQKSDAEGAMPQTQKNDAEGATPKTQKSEAKEENAKSGATEKHMWFSCALALLAVVAQ